MKRLIIAVLALALPLSALADASYRNGSININDKEALEKDHKKRQYCDQFAQVFDSALIYRDNGISPQKALEDFNKATLISLKTKKRVINDVYFNKGLAKMSSNNNTHMMVFISCMSDFKSQQKFKPLK